jgi:hypothetical protein
MEANEGFAKGWRDLVCHTCLRGELVWRYKNRWASMREPPTVRCEACHGTTITPIAITEFG